MDIFATAYDTDAIENGEWVNDIPGLPGVSLKVRGDNSDAYQAELLRLGRDAPDEDRETDGALTIEAALKFAPEAAHKALLLDWKGIERNGKAMKYDPETAKLWCTDPRFKHFRKGVLYAAGIVGRRRAKIAGDLEKN
ncbi:hypothetical protein [Pelagibacterium lentulum]|uniref:Uncharacterized protein n=1 Tax=Pelagibacterium lentulum TaxID=2029865 RepID=A0A916RQ60_9HYPH|nr:hypothetical protein [Pelagibacterium lentulum]GGA64980.1 hypothetical protein GCM10011499_39290 [Pelagibacterium lentulum]